MARHYFRTLAVGALAVLALPAFPADPRPSNGPSVRVSPARARPGDALLVTLEGVASSALPSMSGTAL
ncbi:MAG: hypothetical protein WCK73_04535, partial [Deltaproteobacteria bacterium]